MYILCFMWVMAGWQHYFNWAHLLLQALCYQLYKFTTTAHNLSYLHYLTFLPVVHTQEQCTLKISYLPTSKHFMFKFSCNIITLLHVNSLCYIISHCLTLLHKTHLLTIPDILRLISLCPCISGSLLTPKRWLEISIWPMLLTQCQYSHTFETEIIQRGWSSGKRH